MSLKAKLSYIEKLSIGLESFLPTLLAETQSSGMITPETPVLT